MNREQLIKKLFDEVYDQDTLLALYQNSLIYGGFQMPLVKGKKAKTKEGFSANVKKEMEAGKSQKQSVAIAYSEAGEKKSKKSKGKK